MIFHYVHKNQQTTKFASFAQIPAKSIYWIKIHMREIMQLWNFVKMHLNKIKIALINGVKWDVRNVISSTIFCNNRQQWDPCAFQFPRLMIFVFHWWSIRRKSIKIQFVYNVARCALENIQYFRVYCIEQQWNRIFSSERFDLFELNWKEKKARKWPNSPFLLLLSLLE